MADISVTPANVVPAGVVIRDQGFAGEPIAAGDVVYLDEATNRWFKASHLAVAIDGRVPDAMALNSAATGQPLAVLKQGEVMMGAVLQSGGTYYLSNTPGRLCPAGDLIPDEFISIVGMAKSTMLLDVKILSAQLPAVVDDGEVPSYALLLRNGTPFLLRNGTPLLLRG